MTDTASVPTDALVEHVLAEVREFGAFDSYVSPPERGVEADVEWSLDDVFEWDVATDGEAIELRGMTTAEYSVQTARAKRNPPGAAHPAEYERRTVEIAVTVRADWSVGDGLGEYRVVAEVA